MNTLPNISITMATACPCVAQVAGAARLAPHAEAPAEPAQRGDRPAGPAHDRSTAAAAGWVASGCGTSTSRAQQVRLGL